MKKKFKKEEIREEKKENKLKHVIPLNLSVLLPREQRKVKPLSACDCDNYNTRCLYG